MIDILNDGIHRKNGCQNLHTYGIASHKMCKHTLSKIDLKELHCLLAFPYTVHTKLKILHSQRQYSIGTEWSWHSVYYTSADLGTRDNWRDSR